MKNPVSLTTGVFESTKGRLLPSLIVACFSLLAMLLYFDTLMSMVQIWYRSQTFAHGFLILPISLWLVWRDRADYAALPFRPQPLVLILVGASGALWWIARTVDVQVVEQLAFVAVLITGIWVIVGNAVAAKAAFPLMFLFLAVPMGAELIPPLMELTAYTTEIMVRGSGVPLYREGMFLYLPTGTWSVIAECSGVRYLIASFTLGLIYAKLTYFSIWRRLAFVLASLIVPIVANSLRAYGVVMMGHLSDMRLGVGVDHLVYGWGFFGVIMLLLFWLGGYWADEAPPKSGTYFAPALNTASSAKYLAGCALMALLVSAIWPATVTSMDREQVVEVMPLAVPPPAPGWYSGELTLGYWRPAQRGADRELDHLYAGPASVGLYLRQYLTQQQGVELADSSEPWRPEPRAEWRLVSREISRLENLQIPTVEEVRVRSGGNEFLVWSWYQVEGHATTNPYMVKLLEAKQRLMTGRRIGSRIFLATPVPGDGVEESRSVLRQFLAEHLPAMDRTLSMNLPD